MCQEEFKEYKTAVASKPVLQLPEFNKSFKVRTNASGKAIGWVLVQERHLLPSKEESFLGLN